MNMLDTRNHLPLLILCFFFIFYTLKKWNVSHYVTAARYLYFYVLMSWGPTGGQQTEYNT